MNPRYAVPAMLTTLLLAVSACGDDSSSDGGDDRPSSVGIAINQSEDETPIDVDFVKKNLPVTAGNVVTTVNNAREYDFKGEDATNGGVYDVGQYYDDLTADCKTKITRSVFRADFLARVVPLIDDAQPERVTVTIDENTATAAAKVEQVSGRTLVMDFEIAPGGGSESHRCNADGTISIHAA